MTTLYPEQMEEGYLQRLTPHERNRFQQLLGQEPMEARTDLLCADCGSPLSLRLGRYGRFYGCQQFEATGCKGGVSAHDNGIPKGWPGNTETRAARKRLVDRLGTVSLFYDPADGLTMRLADRPRYQTLCEIVGVEPANGFKVAELDKDQCERAIEALDIFAQPEQTRYDLIRLESLLPDD